MPKWQKRKAGDDFIDDDDASPKRAQKKNSTTDDDSSKIACELSKNRKVNVRSWKGQVLVDIREYYETKDGEARPGKKGISLSLEQWEILRKHANEVDEAIKAIGG